MCVYNNLAYTSVKQLHYDQALAYIDLAFEVIEEDEMNKPLKRTQSSNRYNQVKFGSQE